MAAMLHHHVSIAGQNRQWLQGKHLEFSSVGLKYQVEFGDAWKMKKQEEHNL